MNRLYEEQGRQTKLREVEARIKQDLTLRERIQHEEKIDNSSKIPFRDENIRDDLQNSFEKYSKKKNREHFQLCEEALGRKIGEIKAESKREEKMRQLLWETSPELRELRQQMLLADVTRDQALQLAEKQVVAELRRQEEETLAAAAEEERRRHEEEMRKKEQMEFQGKIKYHKDLDDLRRLKASRKDKDEDQLKREQEAIDEIKRKIEEEAREIAKRKMETQKELHRQAVELQKTREDMQLVEKQKERALEARADEYRKAQELRARQQEEEKRLNLEQRLQLQEELMSYLEKMYGEKASQEKLWTELSIKEKEATEKEKSTAAEQRQGILREEMQQLYDMQMRVKMQKEELQKKEEELFRQNLMAQLYEEEKLEYMSQQKRRMKQIEHRKLAQEFIEEKKRIKQIKDAREKADQKLLEEREAERLRLIEEERKKFLSEHAKELLGYLPKRVFRDTEEIERLGEEFKKFYSRKNCSSIYQKD